MATPAATSRARAAFEARAERAKELASRLPAAAEALRFAADLCRAQGRVAARLEELHAHATLSGALASDLARILPLLLEVARGAACSAPSPLASEAESRAAEDAHTAELRLLVYWSEPAGGELDYLSRAMLAPYAETMRALGLAPDRKRAQGRCPFCSGAPIAGCRRGASESDGAARFLACGLCGLEWPVHRILCPACLEREPAKLPAFQSERFPRARIEACETCRRYVKSLDLSEDARMVPAIDDLASLALDLWAAEQGFARVEPGLAGV